MVHGYLCGIYSSRKLEEACQYRIDFKWLLEERKAPDHSTLARFRTGRCRDVVEDLFYQFVRKLESMGKTDHKAVFMGRTVYLCMAEKCRKATGPSKGKNEIPDWIDHIHRSALAAGRGSQGNGVCQRKGQPQKPDTAGLGSEERPFKTVGKL